MAKSVKQQMYEQLANQHVQQALNNIGMQQFQDAYNAWNAEQDGMAEFQAAYNAWSDANPVQTVAQPKAKAQTIPALNAPDTTDFFKPKTASGIDVNAQAAKDIDRHAFNEAYAKQQQQEQMLAGRTIKPDDIIAKYAEAKGITEDQARQEYERAEAMKSQSIEKAGNIEIDTQAQNDAKVASYLDTSRKLTEQEKKDARALAQEELQKFEYGPNKQPILNTPEERQRYADAVNLLNKTNKLSNALTGAIRQPLNLARAIRDVAGPASKAGSYKQVDESMDKAYENAKTQNPGATTAGELGGQVAMYALTNPLFDSIGAAAGLGKVGSFALNQVGQNLQDVALDTLPTLNRYSEGGLTNEEKKDLLKNIGINAAGNLAFGAAGEGISALAKNRAARNAADAAFRANASEGAERLARLAEEGYISPQKLQPDEIASLNLNPVEANNKQFNELMNTFNHQFKDESAMRNIFTPEDLDASQNAQFRQLMEENLIPERLNPVAEMEMPEDVLGADEIKALSNEYGDMWGGADVPKLAQPEAPKADIPQVEPPKVDNTGVRPRAADQGVSPAIENEAEALAKQMDAEEIAAKQAENVEKPQRRPVAEVDNPGLTDEERDLINGGLFELENPLRDPKVDKAVSNLYGAVKSNEGANLVIKYSDLSAALRKSTDADEAETIVKELADLKKSVNSIDAADKAIVKDILDYNDVENAIAEYKMALNGEDRAAVESAAKALDAARNRIARRKGADPVLKKTFGGDYGPKVKRPLNNFPYSDVTEEDIDDIINGWVEYDINKPNKYVKDAEPDRALYPEKAASGQSNPGQYKMQYFADGNAPREKWATSKLRTNSMEKTGLIKDPNDIPVHEYDYRVYSGAEQRLDFADRYKDSDDIVRDLYEKDAFDEVDMRGAGQTWRDLMKSGDINNVRRANKLGHKMEIEGREGGRLIEAVKEMNRDTPEGQLQEAQEVIGKAIDKRVGKGTTEALNNLYDDILDAFENSKDKDEFAKKVESLLTGDLKQHVSPKTAKTMKSKQIQGKAKIMKMLDKGESLDDVSFDELIDALYKSNGSVTLSPEAQVEIYDLLNQATQYAPDSYEFRKLQAKAARKVMAEVPSGLGDHVRAFLYDNMLGNFKTAFSRNFLGNVAYQTLEKVREYPTAWVDKGVSLVTHKRSALAPNWDKAKAYASGFKKGAAETAADIKNGVNTNRSGQNTFAEALKNNTTVHNDAKKIGHLLNQVDFYVENAMKGGDRLIYEANYAEFKTELEQLLARYGKNGVVGLENVEDKYIPETIDNIAKVRAADAVFQKQGKMSEGLTKLRDGLGDLSKGAFGVDILSTASSPFTLTPGNMLERAIEYTPIGFVKNGIQTGIEAYNKSFDQRRFTEQAGRSLLGLPVLWGAYQGAKKGLISGGYSTDPDERAAQQEDGFIEYGLNVPDNVPILGGKTLDTSDLPVYGPFMQVGSVISEQGLSPQSSLQAAEAVAGGSTLQGIRRAFGADNASYSSQNGIVENLKNTVLSSGSQFVPSLLRQTAQTTDEYKRDLGEYGTKEYYLNLVKNNIPGVRQTLPIKTDVEGEPVLQNQGRGLGSKILENYVLPMNMSEYEPSELNVEASRLRQSTGDAFGFAPKAKRSELRSWDEAEKVEYSEEQFREYKQQLGEMNSEMGTTLINSDFYKGLDDTQKNKALQDSYSAMKAVLKKNMVGKDTDDKLAKAYMEGGVDAVINELEDKYALNSAGLKDTGNARAALDGLGEDGLKVYAEIKESLDGSTSAENIQNELNKRNMSNADKAKYYSYLATDASPGANPYDYVPGVNYNPEKDDSYQKAKAVIPTLDPVNYYKTKDTIDGMEDANNSITQSELIAYITRQNMSDTQAQQYWKAFGGWKNKKGELKKLVKQDGKWVSTY